MKKRVMISFLITVSFLLILLIPLIEFIDWGFVDSISMWIHWPIFALGHSKETEGGIILFIIIWYGVIVGLGTAFINYTIQAFINKENWTDYIESDS